MKRTVYSLLNFRVKGGVFNYCPSVLLAVERLCKIANHTTHGVSKNTRCNEFDCLLIVYGIDLTGFKMKTKENKQKMKRKREEDEKGKEKRKRSKRKKWWHLATAIFLSNYFINRICRLIINIIGCFLKRFHLAVLVSSWFSRKKRILL